MDRNNARSSDQNRGSRGRGRGSRPSNEAETGFPALGEQPQRPQTQQRGVWGRSQNQSVSATALSVTTVPNAPPDPEASPIDARGATSHRGAVPRVTPSTSQGGRAVRGRGIAIGPPTRTRPDNIILKQGTTGTPLALKTNHLFLTHPQQVSLYQYRVDFMPDLDLTKLRKGLYRTAFQGLMPDYLFDGTVLYSTVHFAEPVERLAETARGERFHITMRLVGTISWGDYQYIPILNIIIRKCLKLMNFELIRRDYYDPNQQVQFRFGTENFNVWPGLFTSTRQCERHILLNIDTRFKVMRRENAFDLFLLCVQQPNARQAYIRQVIGTVVMTTYNNKTYRIDDVDFDSTPLTTFPRADGTVISYEDYYRTRYGIAITSPNQPLLISRASRREIRGGMSELIKLVPELCMVTGLTDRQRENFQMMKELGRITRLSAPACVRQLTDFARNVTSNPHVFEEVRKWDIGIANNLLELQGRQLQPETVRSGRTSYSAGPKADWGRELRTKEMFRQNTINKMAVITPAQLVGPTKQFLAALNTAVANMKWEIRRTKIFEISDDRPLSYINMVDTVFTNVQPDIMLIVLPKNSLDRYAAVKQKCTCDRGVLSQFVLAKNLQHKNVLSLATNIAIQMNAKNLGAPWIVPIPLSDVMVVGYDVCRDTVHKTKSFAGMVASTDKEITQYYHAVYEHKNAEELSNNIATFILIACQEFRKKRGALPGRVLIYRDGVGEGQLEFVKVHEVEMIHKKLTELYGEESLIRMAYIIVVKRHSIKFFTMDNQNPTPGTVVDDVVTQPERYDFYLTSHCANQGTVSPTYYNIIHDTMGLPADKLQILTNKLCHLYFNWSGTIKVPAPVQLAHKLAFQTTTALHRPAHPSLHHSLHFL